MLKPLPLEIAVGRRLLERGLTLAVAESCTGGLIGHRLTNVPGSSAYFLGGIIAYSNAAKLGLLGVAPDILTAHGAVSEATALAMAHGARRVLGADIATAVTGIAGPGGGSPAKPVGLTWVALAAADFEQAERYLWSGKRETNKQRSADAVFKMILDYLNK